MKEHSYIQENEIIIEMKEVYNPVLLYRPFSSPLLHIDY